MTIVEGATLVFVIITLVAVCFGFGEREEL